MRDIRRWIFVSVVSLATVVVLPLHSPSNARGDTPPKEAKWKTFVNRAGWKISYPSQWQVGSCHQCSDPTDPNVFVTFFEPSTKAMVTIEPLADKPADEDAEPWLKKVSRDTVLSPQISEEWIVLNHRKALRVINGNLNATSSENIYVLYGRKTFAIRTDRNTPSYATYQRMLSTLNFAPPKHN
jgi:hypothetical protein